MELSMTPSYGGSGGNNTTAAEHDASSDTFDMIFQIVVMVVLCSFICWLVVNCNGDEEERVAEKGLKRHVYGAAGGENTIPVTECSICLSEFEKGDSVRMWPKCNHGFHVRCIDTWLLSHSSCPNCRRSLPGALPEIGDYYFSRFTFY